MSDEMQPLISMTPVINVESVGESYNHFLGTTQYLNWNTGDKSSPDVKDLNEELIRMGVPNHLQCILKVY